MLSLSISSQDYSTEVHIFLLKFPYWTILIRYRLTMWIPLMAVPMIIPIEWDAMATIAESNLHIGSMI